MSAFAPHVEGRQRGASQVDLEEPVQLAARLALGDRQDLVRVREAHLAPVGHALHGRVRIGHAAQDPEERLVAE